MHHDGIFHLGTTVDCSELISTEEMLNTLQRLRFMVAFLIEKNERMRQQLDVRTSPDEAHSQSVITPEHQWGGISAQ